MKITQPDVEKISTKYINNTLQWHKTRKQKKRAEVLITLIALLFLSIQHLDNKRRVLQMSFSEVLECQKLKYFPSAPTMLVCHRANYLQLLKTSQLLTSKDQTVQKHLGLTHNYSLDVHLKKMLKTHFFTILFCRTVIGLKWLNTLPL